MKNPPYANETSTLANTYVGYETHQLNDEYVVL